jgi:prophage maintenance system killer protein/CRISPR/Cas system-associated protein endoribonuclease Cas2
MTKEINEILIYQSQSGAIEFKGDFKQETVWASQKQIAELFSVDVRTINEHIKNIYDISELSDDSTIRKFQIVQKEGSREVKREINHYNLDVILSVGYRVNSKEASQFRRWSNSILKQYLMDGYAINPKRLQLNYDKFQKALEGIKEILPENTNIPQIEVVNLINFFAQTWFSLDAFDKQSFPEKVLTKEEIYFTAAELSSAIQELKENLISKAQATELFAQEKNKNSLEGIIGNTFQSFDGADLYPSIEEKAVHLLYFIIKNHPFNDGNKRSAAFSFIWFLQKAGKLSSGMTPEALTAITLLIAESNPKDKDKIIALVLLLLGENNVQKI